MKRALYLVALALACKSSSSAPPPPPPPAATCAEAVPCVLTSGTAQTGAIATAGQIDFYSIAAPATQKRTLLRITLGNSAPVSPVHLVFSLQSADGSTVLFTRYSPQGVTGPQALGGVFLLPGPATYRLVVRDTDNSHADARNGYSLTATLLTDPDLAEPDDLPPQARPLSLSAQQSSTMGVVAFVGDVDLCKFTVPPPGALVRLTVSQPAAAGPLQIRARLLRRSAVAPDSLAAASAIVESKAAAPGAALSVDVVRSLAPGDYLIALDDASGQQGDPATVWTAGVQLVPNPDPNEQGTTNNTPQTATPLPSTGSTQGAIGSQGDLDWYEVQLPASSTAQLLELTLDPLTVNQDVELTWAVGRVLSVPETPCGQTGLPSAFIADGGSCGYLEHANHHFQHGETQVQIVRLRHLGAAEAVRIVVEDFGDLRYSNRLYTVSARLLTEPDLNEATAYNDLPDAGTLIAFRQDADAGLHFAAEGQISSWDAIDGLNTAQTAEDVDWYHLPLPPRTLAPACPLPDAGQLPDGGPGPDAGFVDAGPCTPDPFDGGAVYLPRPDYGVAIHWHDPSDGAYKLGLSGTLALDAGPACFFSLDQQIARLEDDGGYGYGDKASDFCFCVPGREADQLWVRLEAAHRSIAPALNRYSDLPYSVELDLSPGQLQLACDGGCAGPSNPSSCPGNKGY